MNPIKPIFVLLNYLMQSSPLTPPYNVKKHLDDLESISDLAESGENTESKKCAKEAKSTGLPLSHKTCSCGHVENIELKTMLHYIDMRHESHLLPIVRYQYSHHLCALCNANHYFAQTRLTLLSKIEKMEALENQLSTIQKTVQSNLYLLPFIDYVKRSPHLTKEEVNKIEMLLSIYKFMHAEEAKKIPGCLDTNTKTDHHENNNSYTAHSFTYSDGHPRIITLQDVKDILQPKPQEETIEQSPST